MHDFLFCRCMTFRFFAFFFARIFCSLFNLRGYFLAFAFAFFAINFCCCLLPYMIFFWRFLASVVNKTSQWKTRVTELSRLMILFKFVATKLRSQIVFINSVKIWANVLHCPALETNVMSSITGKI